MRGCYRMFPPVGESTEYRDVYKRQEKYPDLETIWLDGRTETFMEVSERMRRLPQNTCVLLGTWRVDCTESYVIVNTTYMLRDANPTAWYSGLYPLNAQCPDPAEAIVNTGRVGFASSSI